MIYKICKICANLLFISSVRLLVYIMLLVVKFWGVKWYMQIFDYMGSWDPNPALFKGQLYTGNHMVK